MESTRFVEDRLEASVSEILLGPGDVSLNCHYQEDAVFHCHVAMGGELISIRKMLPAMAHDECINKQLATSIN